MTDAAPAFKIEKWLAKMRSEWSAYLVTDAMSSSFGIIDVTVMTVYYRFSGKDDIDEFDASAEVNKEIGVRPDSMSGAPQCHILVQ